jgi:peroxiredoxin
MWRLLFCPILACAGPLVFRAGPPELSKNSGGIAFPMNDAEYQKFVNQGMRNVISVRKLPAGVSPDARYGYNFVIGGKNRGWVLDGDDVRGWVLYLDTEGTGDLSAARPEPFEKVNGVFQLSKEVSNGNEHWPIRFQVTRVKEENEEKLAVAIQTTIDRRGTIEINGGRAAFILTGDYGRYDKADGRVGFDRKDAGEFENYKISDHYVNLFGKTYEFSVDARGDALTLEESDTNLPERPALKPGTPAPSFASTDIAGKPQRLEDYRGRMLLIEFWSTSCGPCRMEAPKMVKFFNETAKEWVSFLGVSSDESEARLRDFLKEMGISWPQIREPWEGDIHRTYRAQGEPTYFLVGPEAEILDSWVGGGLAIDRISRYLKPH